MAMQPQGNFCTQIFSPRRISKHSIKVMFVLLLMFLMTTLLIFNRYSHEITRIADKFVLVTSNAQQKSLTVKTSTVPPVSPLQTNITYYKLDNNTLHHYQFRFEYNISNTNDDLRLMILINGNVRTCVDYWDFAVGRRILTTLHSFRFFILVICSEERTFDGEKPVQKNDAIKWIYISLQKWMNDVFYKQFQRYPRLYFHGISKGSKVATLLSRILPIQQQILTVSVGNSHALSTHSDYPIDFQRRLQLDPTFANWFYFDFCYKLMLNNNNITKFCPFQSDRHHYQPVPPTYFIHLQNDRFYSELQFTNIINVLRQDLFALGGKLLNHTEGVKFYTVPPSNATPTYMQETYDTWRSKPHASLIFYEHYVNRSQYKPINSTRQTCPCLKTDFRYYELYPNITQTWSQLKQDQYKDYANDIEKYIHFFCEDVCADLHTDHGMSSRHLDIILEWINRMDSLRHSLFIEDYLNRPLRIWMYDKISIVTNDTSFPSIQPDFSNIDKSYQMYSPEYYLQDYFQQLKTSNSIARHDLQWSDNPLLADYFIIPSDMTYYYFYPNVNDLYEEDYRNLIEKLNHVYFETLITNIRNLFPYWTMAKQDDQFGSNHILTILNGRNMGLLYNQTQQILKNVIQLVFTGFRQDLLPSNAPIPTDTRGVPLVYRHAYDVVIPPFIRLKPNNNLFQNVTALVKHKTRLLFFAGALSHKVAEESARTLLWKLTESQKRNVTIQIEGKRYDALVVIDGHQKDHEYMDSIQSSVFYLCPEGYFPWSPRFYDAIPLVLSDNIVLPFERFIDWISFTAKVNVSNTEKLIDLVQRIDTLEEYITQKLNNVHQYRDAFKWPYAAVGENGHQRHLFLPEEDQNGTERNALHYISLELRCRRLEQMYGLTSDSFSSNSMDAQRRTCTAHPGVSPCHHTERIVAFHQYF